MRTFAWSPDSKKLVAYHIRPGMTVKSPTSSPHRRSDSAEAQYPSLCEAGDTLDIAIPVLFDVATRQQIDIDRALFPNPYDITTPEWWKNSRGLRSNTISAAIRPTPSLKLTHRPASRALSFRSRRRLSSTTATWARSLWRKKVPSRHRRRQGDHLGVGA